MSDKIRDIVVTISFLCVIIIMLLIQLIKKDESISISERRKLEQMPKVSFKTLFNSSFSEDFDKYTMDQFFKREEFRKLKANIEIGFFKKQDNNNIYKHDESLIEQIYPLNEKSVLNLTNRMNEIKKKYISTTNKVYYTIVPDKNYFVNESNLKLDYDKMKEIMSNNLGWANYIDIFDCLDLSSYYYTDSHWKQEKLQNVANRIASEMNFKSQYKYDEKKIADFKGVYAGRYLMKSKSDEIKILTNDVIENCIVYNYENKKKTKIYDMDKLNALDKYDIYLSGATPLMTITNTKSTENREMIVFRDSYASSLIPLLVEGYSKITLIDTRYISPQILDRYINFENKDILFIYSTMIINNSSSLKF